MAIGSSGRIVIEIEAELKQQLHAALQHEGLTLKGWFVENAHKFLYDNTKRVAIDFSGNSLSSTINEARAPFSAKLAKGKSP